MEKPQMGRPYSKTDRETPGTYFRSNDRKTWYQVQLDGSWRKCPPELCVVLSDQAAAEAAEYVRMNPAPREFYGLTPPDPPASPTVSEQPEPSASEGEHRPSSKDEL